MVDDGNPDHTHSVVSAQQIRMQESQLTASEPWVSLRSYALAVVPHQTDDTRWSTLGASSYLFIVMYSCYSEIHSAVINEWEPSDNITISPTTSPPPRPKDNYQPTPDTHQVAAPPVLLPEYDIQTNPNVPTPARVRWIDACNKVIRKLTEVSYYHYITHHMTNTRLLGEIYWYSMSILNFHLINLAN